MHYSPKHAAPRPSSKMRARVLGVAAAGGATVAATLGSATSAQAAPSNVWDRVAACESGGNWSIATGNGFYGGLQFTMSSWRAAGGTRYASAPHRATRAQQIAAAQRLLQMQGPGAWPVCSRRAGLTRSNGMASGGGAVEQASSRSSSRVGTVVKAKAVNRSTHLPVSRKAVRDTQSWLGLKRTGQWNTTLVRKLQRRVGAVPDGIIGPETVGKTERYIGARRTGLSYFNKTSLNRLMKFAFAHRGL